ncbi:MAG: lysine--tRNA ligase [Bdellovibrionaceae bacterium]|nr:lysine--tRNA ligase [Pseudobdellovibrionaceae bacterium]
MEKTPVEDVSSHGERENPLRAEKRRKLHALKAAGIDPFPHNFERTASAQEVHRELEALQAGEGKDDRMMSLAGRLMTKRPMGKAAFFNIQDQSGTIQGYLKTEELSEADRTAYENLDIGDIVGIAGFPFRTKKGEISIHCREFKMLCKTLEPLPEKYHGLTDVEAKYRHRHLDLITNAESRAVFIARSKIIAEIRSFLNARGFLEVETPMLQPIYGGAAAYPFSTHHRALDMKLFLKISPELYLKRLIVGGFEKVYEVNKNFRNEGIDRSHNPEFTMLEWYEAYTDYLYQMKQFEELIAHLCRTIKGTTKFVYQGKEIDFTPPWRRLTVHDGIREFAGFEVEGMTEAMLFAKCKEMGSDLEKPASRGEMVMEIFELAVEPHLWQPTFVIDHPLEISPLTKRHRKHPDLVERFEPFAAHMEIGNAYTELNDPEDQLARLKEQEAKRVVDEEAQPMDEDFIHAIDTGMPPTGGVGIGVERIVMILTDQPSIRDIILFPTMKFK